MFCSVVAVAAGVVVEVVVVVVAAVLFVVVVVADVLLTGCIYVCCLNMFKQMLFTFLLRQFSSRETRCFTVLHRLEYRYLGDLSETPVNPQCGI